MQKSDTQTRLTAGKTNPAKKHWKEEKFQDFFPM